MHSGQGLRLDGKLGESRAVGLIGPLQSRTLSTCTEEITSRDTTHHKLAPDIPLWVKVIDGKPANPSCKAFVKPELIPPVHCYQVAKPLMGKLMSHNVGYPILEPSIRFLFVEKDRSSSVSDQTPILHGAHGELVDRQ